MHPGIEKCFQMSKTILGIFPGGTWGCFLGAQLPQGGVKTLGHTWDQSQVDSRVKTPKENKHIENLSWKIVGLWLSTQVPK